MTRLARRAADAVAVSHLTVVAFVVGGGFLGRRHPRVARLHLVTIAGAAAIYAGGLDCPLTGWEKGLRRMAGDEVYDGGYLEHYLVSPWHPSGMSPVIGAAILGVAIASSAAAYRDRIPTPARRRAAGGGHT